MTKTILRGTVAVLAIGMAACGRSPVDPPGHALLGTVEIIDRGVVPQQVLATWTHDGGWEGDEPTLSHAAEDHRTRISLGVRMFRRDGSQIPLIDGGEYSARYGVASDPANVINMDTALGLFHGDHVHVYGYHEEGRTGTAQLVFVLWHDGHSDGETDPIAITLTE